MPGLTDPIPFLNLTHEYRELEAEWFAAIHEAGTSGQFILGPNVQAFEEELAAAAGTRHAVALANGTDALMLSLRALDIGPGDEVITSPFTFFATAEVITLLGATPVFADIEADSFNLDPAEVRARVTPRTRAVIPVHLFGYPARMDEIVEVAESHGLVVIEDCAQAFGAQSGPKTVGSFGNAGCFSFYPTKILGCYGDGGMLTTSEGKLAERVRQLRNHGANAPFVHEVAGYNSRLDEIQAALLRIKLRRVERDIGKRIEVAARYGDLLGSSDLRLPRSPSNARHVYNLYTVRSRQRDRLREHLTAKGVPTAVCYPVPLHLQTVYASLGYRQGDLPAAEQAAREVLSLPVYPDMPHEHIERVSEAIKEVC